MSRAAFFINPLSHTVKKHGSVLANCADLAAIPAAFLDPFYTIDDVISGAAAAQCDQIFIEGGDGTIQGVLTALMKAHAAFKTLPEIILLPGGMTNAIAKQIGMRKPTPGKIAALINASTDITRTPLPMLRVQSGAGAPQYGFLLSTGALPRGTRYCTEEIHKRGIEGSAAILSTICKALVFDKALRAKILQPTPLKLQFDTVSIDQDHFLFMASTLQGGLTLLHPFWGEQDAPLRISYASAGAQRILRNVISMVRSSKSARHKNRLLRDGFQSWNVDQAHLSHSGDIVLDGEFLPAEKGQITISTTRPLTFVRPA